MHTSGHHLEYAGFLAGALSDHELVDDVQVVTAQRPTPQQQSDYFEGVDIDWLEAELSSRTRRVLEGEPAVGDQLRRLRSPPRGELLSALVEYVDDGEYDAVHLLHADDILLEMVRSGAGTLDATVHTSLNGAFFAGINEGSVVGRPELASVRPLQSIHRRLPSILSRSLPWRFLSLRAAVSQVVDGSVFVHSESASDTVDAALPETESERVSVVPDPLELWFENDLDQTEARERIDLPESAPEPVVLFFGELREEKGVETLLRAIEAYAGPPFTVIVGGKPTDIDPARLGKVFEESNVRLVDRLGFVPQEDVEPQFTASDAVVLPYQSSYGTERTSGVFQKACGAARPVLISDVGTLGDRVRQHGLGTCFPPEDSEALTEAFRRFVEQPDDLCDREAVVSYAESQSYDELASQLVDGYTPSSPPPRQPPRTPE